MLIERRRARPVRRAQPWVWWAALVVLVCAGTAIVPASLIHTDDGCAVEVHCVACRWAYNAQLVLVEVPVPVALHEAPDRVEADPVCPPAEAPIERATSRGPPAA